MSSAHKTVGSVIVTKHQIIGTKHFVFGAYEASAYSGRHSSLLSIDGQCCGSLASRPMPAEIAALPVGPARWEALDEFRAANEAEAYAAIVAAFPEAADGERSRGEIEIWA